MYILFYIKIFIYLHILFIYCIYFFSSCFYLIMVTSRNSHPIVNMFQVNDKEARTS